MKRILLIALATIGTFAQAQNYESGEKIYKANCVSCHKMDGKVIGPPLADVVSNQGAEWTKKWIYNNQELRDAGDAHALAIYEEYNKQVMPAYSFLSDQELDDLVTYLGEWKEKQTEAKPVETASPDEQKGVQEKPARKLSATGKVIIGACILGLVMIVVTFYVLLSAFKTMVQVNRELQKQKD